jgi:glycosyltransferase involved in cell wall biosynthesis
MTSGRVAALGAPGVEILGAVPELGDLYDAARVFVAPTRFSAGVPLKVYEAASRGVPVVATELLATQLGWEPDQELVVSAAEPAAFAAAVARLYTDEALWRLVREAALARVQRECSEAVFAASVERALAVP